MSRRILLMYISDVSGHKQATIAVKNAIHKLDPQAEVLNINAFNYTNPISEKVINKLYMGVIKRTPKVWEYLYDNPKVVKKTANIKEAIHRFNAPKLKALFDKFRPDAVACSQAFPCGMAAYFKKAYKTDLPLVGIVTDYTAHSYWVYDNVDYYIVPSGSIRQQLINKGVKQEKIKTLGIPIEPAFSQPHNRESIIKGLGMDPLLPVVLVMGGGQGLGPISRIIRVLDKMEAGFQIIVVCGTNKKLYEKLNKKKNKFKKKAAVFGFAGNIGELMAVSSLVITKPGGMTTAEALAKALPVIIVEPIPGQEESNTQYLLKKGVAIKVEDTKDLPACISDLLLHPEKIDKMSKKARQIGKPQSSEDAARFLLGLCENSLND